MPRPQRVRGHSALRMGIANFHAKSAADGATPAFALLVQLTTPGGVMMDAVPDNPYDTDATKNNVAVSAAAKGTVSGGAGGWLYNSANRQIWPNSTSIM